MAEHGSPGRARRGFEGASQAVTPATTLGHRIRAERHARGRSIREIAGDSLSPSLVSRIERDQVLPSLDSLRYLAARLDRSVAYLLTGDDLDAPGRRRPDELLASFVDAFEGALAGENASTSAPAEGPMGDVAPVDLVREFAAAIHRSTGISAGMAPPGGARDGGGEPGEPLEHSRVGTSELAAFYPAALRAIGAQLGEADGEEDDGERAAASLSRPAHRRTAEEQFLLAAAAARLLPDDEERGQPPALATIVRERLGAAYHDLQRARAAGDVANALLAAGWGMGLLEMQLLCQSCVDLLVARTLQQPVTEASVSAIERVAEALGFTPGRRMLLLAAKHALERRQPEWCARLLGLIPAEQMRADPSARAILAHLALSRGDAAEAVEQWTRLAEDPSLPIDFVIATLMEAGMRLDEERHPAEAQAMYRRAAALWQRLGPRSAVASRVAGQDRASRLAGRGAARDAQPIGPGGGARTEADAGSEQPVQQ